jgi:hypothetical protein
MQRRETARKQFFFEEKNQKTFTSCGSFTMRDLAGKLEPAEELKVFCFFFSKKKCLLSPTQP